METPRKQIRRLSEVNHIDRLPDDLVAVILIRGLPNPRSACCCKTVCKRWMGIISTPSFNRGFVSHHRSMNESSPPQLIHTHDVLPIICFMPTLNFQVEYHFKVLDCFKDLLLCGFMGIDADNPELSRTFVLCNPFTQQWLTLPLAPKKARGYGSSAARLVCEPRISHHLDLGGDNQAFVYSEYRFRVAIIYQHERSVKLDLFCSESGEWTGEALVLDGYLLQRKTVVSCNGEMFWVYTKDDGQNKPLLAVFNPFRVDIPPTLIDSSTLFENPGWGVTVSQGAVHVVVSAPGPRRSGIVYSVWRLEQDRKSWSKQFEGLMKTSMCSNYDLNFCEFLCLHPEQLEIAFFEYWIHIPAQNAYLSCDLRRGELEFFTELGVPTPPFRVLQPRLFCWPTPIPRYKELRGKYKGRYSSLVQSTEATTSSITGRSKRKRCRVVEKLEQFGHRTDQHHTAGVVLRS